MVIMQYATCKKCSMQLVDVLGLKLELCLTNRM